MALACLVLVYAGTACGGGPDDPNSPRAKTLDNLAGYWAGVRPLTDSGAYQSSNYEPILLHIRPGKEDEPQWYAELLQSNGVAEHGAVELTDGWLLFYADYGTGPSETPSERFQVSQVTGVELDLSSDEGPLNLQRQDGCGAPGTYLPAPGDAKDAAFGPDGTLYTLPGDPTFGIYDGQLHVRRAPDCLVKPIAGAFAVAVDAVEADRVRLLDAADVGLPPKLLTLKHDGEGWIFEDEERLPGEAFGQVYRLAHDPSGQPVVIGAKGPATRAWWKKDGAWTNAEIPVSSGSQLSPLYMWVKYDDDGHVYVKSDNWGRLVDGEWEEWSPPQDQNGERPLIVDWTDDGDLVGLFTGSSGNAPITLLGRWNGTEWTRQFAGFGTPWDVGVHGQQADAVIMPYADSSQQMTVGDVSLAEPDSYPTQHYVKVHTGTFSATNYSNAWKYYPVAAFGPSGATFVSNEDGGVRLRAAERGDMGHTTTLNLEFDADVPGEFVVPRTGDSCSEDCAIEIPWNEMVFAFGRSEEGSVSVSGTNDSFFNAIKLRELGQSMWMLDASRQFSDETQASESTFGVRVAARAVESAHALPPEVEEGSGSSAETLDRFPDGRLLVHYNANLESGMGLEIRAADGAPVARVSDCALGVASMAATSVGAVVVAESVSDCPDIESSGSHVIWFDDTLSPEESTSIERPDASAVMPDGTALTFYERYDSSEGRQWIDVVARSPGGASQTHELDRAQLGDSVWGVEGGFAVRDGTAVAMFSADATELWRHTVTGGVAADGFDVQVADSRIFVLIDPEPETEFAGQSPDSDYQTLSRDDSWLLEIDRDSGEVTGEMWSPAQIAPPKSSIRRAGSGRWLVVNQRQKQLTLDAYVDGERVVGWTYDNSESYNCMGGGCIYRQTHMVSGDEGRWWVLTSQESGSVDYDGVTVTASHASRAVLLGLDPSTAWSR